MFGWRFWGLSLVYALGSGLFIGIPTVLIPNPLFRRMTPTSVQDYLIWAISSMLLGAVLALATLSPMVVLPSSTGRTGNWRTMAGALLSVFSVGCPICNKFVVLVLGLGGAMTVFNPLRPFLGIASIALLSVTLFVRVRVARHGCPVPIDSTVRQRVK